MSTLGEVLVYILIMLVFFCEAGEGRAKQKRSKAAYV